ncbi:MAG: dimethyl sulfoxide reductase anchor subunit [Alphaproteobacteria bacterium]|nr:dimethyl sulfoxide reductase anchor subunit [Alphaproteobacteria bacterium]
MAVSSLKNILRPGFVGHSFKSGYRFQRYWDRPMASAFFCGETGAGLFIVSMLADYLPGIILGLLITGIGKTFFHLTHMGVPAKSWRAILRPDRSWISRGLIGIVFFVGFGSIYALGELFHLMPGALAMPVYLLAMAGAIVVVVYQGFAMSYSTAIALWSTGLMPVLSMLYGLLAGTSLVMLLDASGFAVARADRLAMVATAEAILIIVVLMALLSLLHGAKNGAKGAQQSYQLLMHDILARPFLLGVVAVGIIIPFLILLLLPVNFVTTLIVTGSILVGFCLFRLLIFRAAVIDPILSPADIFRK